MLQQEMILKSVLTRSGFDNPAVVGAHIIPTDHFDVPALDPVQPTAGSGERGLAEAARRSNKVRSGWRMRGSTCWAPRTICCPRFAHLGDLATADWRARSPPDNHVADLRFQRPDDRITVRSPRRRKWIFSGRLRIVPEPVVQPEFPQLQRQFSLTVPIRNRAAQADLITDELNYRQSQIQDKQLQNNIKLNVINAQTALKQARAAYETAWWRASCRSRCWPASGASTNWAPPPSSMW